MLNIFGATIMCHFIEWWRMTRVITIIEWYHFANMPVFGRMTYWDDVLFYNLGVLIIFHQTF